MTFNSWREGYDYLTRLMSRKSIPQGKWGRGVYLFGCMERDMLIKNHTFGMSLLLFTGVCLLGSAEYSSIDKMAKYDWSTFRNYVAFLAGELAPGTRHPHHDSESSSCYHDTFLP